MSETESTSEIDYRSDSDDSESSTESEIEEVQHNVKTSSKSIKDEEPSDAMVNELLAKYSPNEVYNIIKGSMSNSEKKIHKSHHHHHIRSISRSRSRSTHRRSKGRKHSKESLDEPPKSKRGRKSSSKKDDRDVPPPPSRMTKAELQIELKKTREMIKKMQNKLEKSANPKKEKKPKKDLEIDDEDIKEIVEETKPLGNDIVGREIQGEPIEPVYLK